jgi:NAD(P)-dependent dehydrogenase (short-subunit alcohol dehydrogenase family)
VDSPASGAPPPSAFAKKGAKVVVAGRRDEAGRELVKELLSFGSEAEFINADLRKESDVRELIDKTVARFGRLDVAVNNAATEGAVGPISDQTAETFNQIFELAPDRTELRRGAVG